MTTYYIDYVNGSDANNGLGPDATTGNTNKPWKTLNKAVGASGMASGDTAYLSPAGPFRESITMAMTSPTVETKILGDPANAQGFKTSAGVLVAPGPVICTSYTTNDKTAPSTFFLKFNGKSHFTFRYITFMGGGSTVALIDATTTTSTDVLFENCVIAATNGNNIPIQVTAAFGVALNWTFNRCLIYGSSNNSGIKFSLTTGTGSDWDANVLIENCLIFSAGIIADASGAGANKGGGVRAKNCTIMYPGCAFRVNSANNSTTFPCTINNSIMLGCGNPALAANTSGQLTEDYNVITATTARSNVTAGTHSISDGSYAPMLEFGGAYLMGFNPRAILEPMAGSPMLGFGNDGNQTATDGFNRPRPAGGASALPAVGWLERSNTAVHQTTTVHGSQTDGLSITGPGYQDWDVEVDAIAQTISVYMQYDSTYDITNGKPKIEVLANTECGVTASSAQMTAAANTWEQRTLTFTPNAKGIVTIRISSLDANGGGKVYASDKSGW